LTHLQAANRNLQLEIQPCDPSYYILADRARLIQALVNLIDSGISLTQGGKITVTTNCEPQTNEIKIEIELQCPASFWQENSDIMPSINKPSKDEIKKLIQEINLSPGMRLLLSQTLIETMGGRLELVDLSPSITQIIISCQKSTKLPNN
jgi:nitrogen-specific signal transduction histidine kinase